MNQRSREEDERRFLDDTNEWRRLFAELLGTFLLVFVAAGAELVNAGFGSTWQPGPIEESPEAPGRA